MQIVSVKIGEITPYKNNAKKYTKEQTQKVANSIKKFGFVQPLVLDKNKEIIIGHCRFEAGKLLKMEEMPCVMADNLTDDEVQDSCVILRLFDGVRMVGSISFGKIINCISIFQTEPNTSGLELNRLAIVDDAPKNN